MTFDCAIAQALQGFKLSPNTQARLDAWRAGKPMPEATDRLMSRRHPHPTKYRKHHFPCNLPSKTG